MSSRAKTLFLLVIVAQAAHSVEEYRFRLYDLLAPARFISGLVSSDLAWGFAVANVALVSLGVWCYVSRVRPGRPSSPMWAWSWALLEAGNGTGHLLFALSRRGYFPGAWTAPLLLGLAIALGVTLSTADEQGIAPPPRGSA
jgi:hypothetical protein